MSFQAVECGNEIKYQSILDTKTGYMISKLNNNKWYKCNGTHNIKLGSIRYLVQKRLKYRKWIIVTKLHLVTIIQVEIYTIQYNTI